VSRIYGAVRQLGMVVADIDDAIAAAVARYAIGPFYVLNDVQPSWFRYRGADSPPPLLSLAFAFSGHFQIEIIQQHDDAPSAYREFLDSGRQGPQHLSSWFSDQADYDRVHAAAVESAGVPIHEGQIGQARFAYFDTVDANFGLAFEISEMLLPGSAAFWQHVEHQSLTWDGGDPVRDLRADRARFS
jgi:hypothetical protein